ncbi:MAG: hypothetical protein JWP58_4339 [Hymenobacter sp.]|nr:hypothetical protein [Hymenobacter sp.]
MTAPLFLPAASSDAAVLLVLLRVPVAGVGRAGGAVSPAALDALQQQLGAAVRVLRIDASTHPLVVSSFHATDLPCFVLVRHGIELWRACGLPDLATIGPLLLGKLEPIPETTPQT